MLNDNCVNFNFSENYILEDDCVLLRPLQQDDCNNLLEFSLNEPETWYYGLISAAGEENLKQYVQDAIKAREEKNMYPFIVYDKTTKSYAGSTRFYDIKTNYKTTQLGYTWYGKNFRGTGLNKRCKNLLLQFAFDQCNFLRVEFRADALNARSIAAMKSIGCVEEGILRQDLPNQQGGRRTSMVLSILQQEWTETVQQKIKSQIEAIDKKQ